MKKGIAREIVRSFVCLLILLGVLTTKAATVVVNVSFFNLSPNPVNIQVNDAVYWIGDDDDFPYIISGPWGDFATPGGIQFLAQGKYDYTASWVLGGGSWGGTVNVGPGAPNTPPAVTITNPTNNAVFTAPASFQFEADASDADPGDLWDVKFWVGDQMVDDVYDPPFATTVTGLAAGTYTLTAIAWDLSFATATNTITITVTGANAITLTAAALTGGNFEFTANGLTVGKTYVLETSANLASPEWSGVSTNVADSASASFTNAVAAGQHFFRIAQLP